MSFTDETGSPTTTRPLRCFVIGGTSLVQQCLEIWQQAGHQVLGLISDDQTLRARAAADNLPHHRLRDNWQSVLHKTDYDILFSIVNDLILPSDILQTPRLWAINYHDGPLPRYAGMHATAWAIINQEAEHAVTWHSMQADIDTGLILARQSFPIRPQDTSLTLNARAYEAAVHAFAELVRKLSQNQLSGQPQDPDQRSYFGRHQRPAAAALLNWTQTALQLAALSRALHFGPYPNPLGRPKLWLGNRFVLVGQVLAEQHTREALPPGTILAANPEGPVIATSEGTVQLRQFSSLTGAPIDWPTLAAEQALHPGDVLPSPAAGAAAKLGQLSEHLARHEDFWRRRLLTRQPVALPLTGGPTQSDTPAETVNQLPVAVPPAATPADLLAAFATLCARLTQHWHFDLDHRGPSTRLNTDFSALFADQVPWRVRLNANDTPQQATAATTRELGRQARRQTFALDLLAREPGLSRLKRQTSLLSPMLHLVDGDAAPEALPNTNLTFSLNLEARQAAWFYNPQHLNAADMARLTAYFDTLLQAWFAKPEHTLATLPLLPPAEKQQLLTAWNQTTIPYPEKDTFVSLFAAQVQRTPQAIAAEFQDRRLTYTELDARANQLAHYLQQRGIGPDVPVGLYIDRSLEALVGLLGVLKAGGAYVPLDPAYPRQRLTFMLQDSAAPIVLTRRAMQDNLDADNVVVLDLGDEAAAWRNLPTTAPAVDLHPEHLIYVIYTSGSTGRPKGTLITHRGVVNYLHWANNFYNMAGGSGAPVQSSLAFDATVTSLLGPLLAGRTVFLLPEDHPVEDLAAALQKAQAQQRPFSLIKITPAHLDMLNRLLPAASMAGAVNTIVLGGEALPAAALRLWQQHAPETRLINEYGPTETVVGCCIYEVQPGEVLEGTVPIGRPIANTRLYVLDPQQQPVPIGVPGELYIGGQGVGRGYLNRPERSAAAFITDPFSNEAQARLYRTGDRVHYRPDGVLVFQGRLDDQVKLRGYRIELGEIEAALYKQPGVEQAAVLLREDQPGDPRLVAYVAPPDSLPDPDALQQALTSTLPEYMVPSALVTLPELPLTPNKKIDRRALPAPATNRPALSTPFVPPRNPLEEIIARTWAEVLGMDEIGIHDDFFELGGHSLQATRVVARLREQEDLPLTLRRLFEAPTVAGLSRTIAQVDAIPSGEHLGPITPIDRRFPAPLSFAQQRLWFLNQLKPDSVAYNIPLLLSLSGPLNINALQAAVADLQSRHEILRTRFIWQEGIPRQEILPHLPIAINTTDLSAVAPAEQATQILHHARQAAAQTFDLSTGPLLHLHLLRLNPDEHRLVFIVHHIIADGWSMGVLVDELAALYQARIAQHTVTLPPPAVQYADFAAWQRRYLHPERLTERRRYWEQQLADSPPLLELPTDFPRPQTLGEGGERVRTHLAAELHQALLSLSRQADATLFMTLLAAFKVLLYRYTGQTDLLVGTPAAGRDRAEVENLIGFFINTLVLRSNLAGEPDFLSLLAQIRHTTLEAFEHQDMPFDLLVEALHPQRNLSYTPVVQVVFALQPALPQGVQAGNLHVSAETFDSGTAKFDLTLEITETDTGLACEWEYNHDLFARSSIESMAACFEVLLESIVARPETPITRLRLLPSAMEATLLQDWGRGETLEPDAAGLHQLFEAQVEANPAALAIAWHRETLTYAELEQQANQLAHTLIARGLGPDNLVAICLPRTPQLIVAMLGVLKAGAAYVPLNPHHPPARLQFVLDDTQAALLISDTSVRADLPPSATEVFLLDEQAEMLAQQPRHRPAAAVSPANLAYVIYTSGSTGRPKGVAIEHHGAAILFTWTRRIFAPESLSGVVAAASVTFDLSVYEIFLALSSGGTVILLENVLELPTLQPVKPVTYLGIVPSAMVELVKAQSLPASLHTVMLGGEALKRSLADAVYDQGVQQIVNLYGPTEDTVCSTYALIDPAGSDEPPIGRPMANTRLYVLDAHQHPVPIGVPGELYISSDSLARAYLNRPDLTRERFLPDPFRPDSGARMYRSGDWVRYRHDGQLEYLGRIDKQVKLRGFRIELGEIEAMLNQHPAVQESVVRIYEPPSGAKQLLAYAIPRPNTQLDLDTLKVFLQARLPEYMLPQAFVPIEHLPLTSSGKVDTDALPVPNIEASAAGYVPPENAFEQLLAEMWARVLNVERVGRHDNFFALGGDSILSIQLIALANLAGFQLTSRQLFQHQTLAELAAVVEVGGEQQAEQGPVSGPAPLTPIQHWFFEQDFPEPQIWNQTIRLTLSRPAKPDHLAAALEHVLAHHDALRLCFHHNDAGRHQEYPPPAETASFTHLDLSTIPAAERDAATAAALNAVETRFDLAQGPLTHLLHLVPGGSEPEQLVWAAHHLVVDGVSWRVLLEDLQLVYRQLEAGLPVALRPKTTAYRDWSEFLVTYAQSSQLAAEITYWRELCTHAHSAIPCDLEAAPETNTEDSSTTLTVTLTAAETQALLQIIPRDFNARLNEALLTAFGLACSEWLKQDEIWLDLEGHGREELADNLDLSRTVGWFTSLYPFRLQLPRNSNLQLQVQAVRRQLKAVPQSGIGFGVLRYLHPDPDLRADLNLDLPLAFNYLGQFDQAFADKSLFQAGADSLGGRRSPHARRSHLLALDALITGNRLQLSWTYSPRFHHRQTIAALAESMRRTLRRMLPPDAVSNQGSIPLSRMQQIMWPYLDASNPAYRPGVYHVQQTLHLQDNTLSVPTLEAALQRLHEQYPALHTRFSRTAAGELRQHPDPDLSLNLQHFDGRGRDPAAQAADLAAFQQRDLDHPFDLLVAETGLYRWAIFQHSPREASLFMAAPHLLLDGWGFNAFLNELLQTYTQLKHGRPLNTHQTDDIYAQFVAGEQATLNDAAAIDFWRPFLTRAQTFTRPRLSVPETPPRTPYHHHLPASLSEALAAAARRHNLPLRTLYLSAFLDVLAAQTETGNPGVALVSNGRSADLPASLNALGLFWATVPFQHQVEPNKRNQVHTVQRHLVNVEFFNRYPPAIAQAATHSFASFNYVNFHNAVTRTADVQLQLQQSHDRFHWPFNLLVSQLDISATLTVEYDPAFFAAAGIKRWLEHYQDALNVLSESLA